MKLERINDNKIRCILTGNDLSSREIMLSELAYGSDKARALFRDMMELAAEQLGFETDDMPIVVEAVPLEGGSIVLTISKVENPEELDARFSRFSPFNDTADSGPDTGFSFPWPAAGEYDITDREPSAELFTRQAPDDVSVFEFASLAQVTQMSRHLRAGLQCLTTLYKNPLADSYYLAVVRSGSIEADYLQLCRLASEYGAARRKSAAAGFLSHAKEHYTLILKDQAVQRLRDL